MTLKLRLNLIGGGNVGQTICRLIAHTGLYEVQDIANRSFEKAVVAAAFIGTGRPVEALSEMRSADIWLITVPDTKISEVAETLAGCRHDPAIAMHCSGFLPALEMAALGEQGWHLASAHPVLTFSDPDVSVRQFAGSFCGLEGDTGAIKTLAPMLSAIGARCFPVNSDAKAVYHAAAVIANNLTTVLQAVAQEAWAQAGVPEEIAHDLHAVLLRSTVDNTLALGPQTALTGPAARGDTSLVTQQHAAIAAWHPEAGQAYDVLSTMATRLKKTGKTR